MLKKSCLGILLLTLLGTMISEGTAFATSSYDNVLQLTSSLHLSRNGSTQGSPACSALDITSNWMNILNDDSSWWPSAQFVGGATRENTQADFATALDNRTGWAVSEIKYSNSTTTGTGIYSIGDGVRIVFSPSTTNYVDFATYYNEKYMAMRNTDDAPVYAVTIQFHSPNANGTGDPCTPQVTQSIREPGTLSTYLDNRAVATRPTNSTYTVEPLFVNAQITYPSGYEGVQVPLNDNDSDGLTEAEENAQGTSDSNNDTDGDGLSDIVESQWYSNRNSVFCGSQCAYPNPIQKDLYVEIDWMKNSSNHTYKPTATQLNLVKDMFANKNIVFHADIGQFGGGNELATYTQTLPYTPTPSQLDYLDYRNGGDGVTANFSANRNLIWRYMIYGHNYSEHPTSSGWGKVMGVDSFISGDVIENASGAVSLDRAVANSIAHEIGHNLCLSDIRIYQEQPTECAYAGIDNHDENSSEYNLENYASVMNYRYQLTDQDDFGIVNYSDGSHGSGDHNDWAAVMLGINKFSGTHTELGAIANLARYSRQPDGSVIVEEETPLPKTKTSDTNNTEDAEKTEADKSSSTTMPQTDTERASSNPQSEVKNQQPLSQSPLLWGGVVAVIALIAASTAWIVKKKR